VKVRRLSEAPAYVQGSRLLEEAYELAADAHSGPGRRKDTDVAHPIAVARLLHERGYDDEVVAAALLHDVREDTGMDGSEIEQRCGPDVGGLVSLLTEDASIEDYEARKREHRARVARSGSRVAAIYAADKLAKVRGLRDHWATVPDAKLHHYKQTLRELRGAHPELPFLAELETELQAVDGPREGVGRR
jgi:guanosine-3',5'-bis(diphosphate) 3'-pyrophosphohydrolase